MNVMIGVDPHKLSRGVMVTVREAGDVAAIADDRGGQDRADAVEIGEGGARHRHGVADPFVRCLELVIEVLRFTGLRR